MILFVDKSVISWLTTNMNNTPNMMFKDKNILTLVHLCKLNAFQIIWYPQF